MSKVINTKENWLDWAIKLQALAQAGLHYSDNPYEIERYEEIRDISCEIMNTHCDSSIEQIENIFCCERGYQTPKMDSRAVCFKDDKILLAQENTGLWAVPGGWIDVDQTVRENTIKEAKEEAGAEVVPKFVICLHDWRTHICPELKNLPFQICKIFVMCDVLSVDFQPNNETLQSGFFARDELPPLAIEKINYEQIDLCFQAHEAEKQGKPWVAQFD